MCTSVPRRRLPVILILLILVLSLGGAPARASSPLEASGPALGPPFDIFTDGLPNHEPVVTYNSVRGEFLVVWHTEQGPNTWDLWARRVGIDGSLRSTFNVASYAGWRLTEPAVAYNPQADQYVVAYRIETTAGYAAAAKMVNGDGAPSPSWTSAPYLGASIEHPTAAYNPETQDYLIIYEEEATPPYSRIVARPLDAATGSPTAPATILATSTGATRYEPDVAYQPLRGNYLVVYTYDNPAASQYYLAGKIVSPDLTAGPEMQINDSIGLTYDPAVAAGPDGYLCTWSGGRARRVGFEGAPLGPGSFALAVAPPNITIPYLRLPDVAFSPVLGYLAAFELFDGSTLDESDVLARYVRPFTDAPAGDEILVDGDPHFQAHAGVACAPNGTCLIAYESNANGSGDLEIRGRLLSPWRVYVPLARR